MHNSRNTKALSLCLADCITVLLVIIIGSSLAASASAEETDTLYIETVNCELTEQAVVHVTYTNFTGTGLFSIRLRYDNSLVHCDSVSLVGVRYIPDESVVTVDNDSGLLSVFGFTINGPILGPGSGLIASLFFTAYTEAESHFVHIDTALGTSEWTFAFAVDWLDPDSLKATECIPGGICFCEWPTADTDGDQVPDCCDICSGFDDRYDTDGDGVPDGCDNCPFTPNPTQDDFDNDGIGDACCCIGISGDLNGDGDEANILDLNFLVNYIFRGSDDPGDCPEESDVNDDGDSANIFDLNYLVNYIFRGGPAPGPC
jgi:hypothetical protein